jgi:hypothetical protein
MQSGVAYAPPTSERRTGESGSSSWPTATAGDAKGARNATATRHRTPPTGIHAGHTLTDAVSLWATPTSATSRAGNGKTDKREGGPTLNVQVNEQIHGRLNPAWVEHLMGFPPGWTDLPPGPPPPTSPSTPGRPRASRRR